MQVLCQSLFVDWPFALPVLLLFFFLMVSNSYPIKQLKIWLCYFSWDKIGPTIKKVPKFLFETLELKMVSEWWITCLSSSGEPFSFFFLQHWPTSPYQQLIFLLLKKKKTRKTKVEWLIHFRSWTAFWMGPDWSPSRSIWMNPGENPHEKKFMRKGPYQLSQLTMIIIT